MNLEQELEIAEILDSDYYTPDELTFLGFNSVGKNTRISRKISLYDISGRIGDNVRIDDFCILKGHIEIGSHVHICAYCMISGAQAKVTIESFAILAARCSVYSGSNDHGADVLGAPLAPPELTKQNIGPVHIGFSALIGAHCIILPNVTLGDCCSIGASCVIVSSVPEGGMMRAHKSIKLAKSRNVQKIKEMALRVLENET